MDKIDINGSYIYHLLKGGEVVYVGQSNNLIYRLNYHRTDKGKDFDHIEIFKTKHIDLSVAEFMDIAKHNPKLNKILPTLFFAIYETRVKQINKCLDDAGIPFEKYDMKMPDISITLNGKTHKVWAKRGLKDVFHDKLNKMIDAMGVKDA